MVRLEEDSEEGHLSERRDTRAEDRRRRRHAEVLDFLGDGHEESRRNGKVAAIRLEDGVCRCRL